MEKTGWVFCNPWTACSTRNLAFYCLCSTNVGHIRMHTTHSEQLRSISSRKKTGHTRHNDSHTLPSHGYVRLPVVVGVCGIARSTVWAWAAQGRFPKPVKLSPRVSAWAVIELQEWLADPAGWRDSSKAGEENANRRANKNPQPGCSQR